jgi:hypothetical protein
MTHGVLQPRTQRIEGFFLDAEQGDQSRALRRQREPLHELAIERNHGTAGLRRCSR